MNQPLLKAAPEHEIGATLDPAGTRVVISSYIPSDPVGAHYQQQCLALIERYPTSFANRYSYQTGQHGHFTAQAIIFNPNLKAIALARHKKLNILIGFGGHVEPGDVDLIATATREANEESGLKNLRLCSRVPIDIDVHGFPAKGDQPDHLHYDIRFLYTTTDTEFAPGPGESNETEWVTLTDLPQRMGMWLANSRLIRYLQANLG